ncbi:hypothetical protein PR048_012244 [Dryococelus australis]|uniref:Uncharacterized protein n=1 Tax=Dryococelus australis TaxID=614101 RepID=A0ABQ9HNV6_9NEOP|nr:hypothetical protein PR048_012244 [Dryococelus australis]
MFSHLGATSAFWAILLDRESSMVCKFYTSFGHYNGADYPWEEMQPVIYTNEQITLSIDASKEILRAVLLQNNKQIAYVSTTLTPAQCN